MKLIDVLIFIPLTPMLPMLATWYLPWETWIPRRVSKSIIGPYLLYCAFGAWYFKLSGWVVAGALCIGIITCTAAFFSTERFGRTLDVPDTRLFK